MHEYADSSLTVSSVSVGVENPFIPIQTAFSRFEEYIAFCSPMLPLGDFVTCLPLNE